jgi:hypothetical protein
MEAAIWVTLRPAMKAAAAAAVLVEMEAPLQPLESLEALEEEVLVGMVEMSLFRLTMCSVAEAAEVEA